MNKISPSSLHQLIEAILNDEQELNAERKNPDTDKKAFDKKTKNLHLLKTAAYALLDGMEQV